MKAILLSAGRGRRLAGATNGAPKCLVAVHEGRSLLECQLRALARGGVDHAVVMVGYGADRVEAMLKTLHVPGLQVRTEFNPFSATSDNLVTAWLARAEMNDDFLLLNGDTLFEERVLTGLLARHEAPVHMAINHKGRYDEDDMKVVLSGDGSLKAIGKALPGMRPDGEAIGMTVFRGEAPRQFQAVLDEIVRSPEGMRAWYTSALDGLAQRLSVRPVSIGDAWWGEVDTESDLLAVREALRDARRGAQESPRPTAGVSTFA